MQLTLLSRRAVARHSWPIDVVICGWSRATAASPTEALADAIERLIEGGAVAALPAPTQRAIVVGSDSAARLQREVFADEIRRFGMTLANPARFPYTAPNAVSGMAAIRHRCEGPNVTLQDGARSVVNALVYAADLVCLRRAEIVFAGGFESAPAGSGSANTSTAVVAAVMSATRASSVGARPAGHLTATGFGGVVTWRKTKRPRGRRPHGVREIVPIEADTPEQSLMALEEALTTLATAARPLSVILSAGRVPTRATRLLLTNWSAHESLRKRNARVLAEGIRRRE